MSIKRWTPEELNRALEMRRSGTSLEVIGHVLGRSVKSIRTHISYANMTPAQKEKRNEYERNRRKDQNKTLAKDAGIKFNDYRATVPAEVLANRVRRNDAPFRDLTAAIFGDPPVGYSALERRA